MKKVMVWLFGHEGRMNRLEFFLVEMIRGAAVGGCYLLYKYDLLVLAAFLLPVALWPGIVGTIKRFRDIGHDPIWILPVLMYLSVGFAAGYVWKQPAIGLVALGLYLVYALGRKGTQVTT